MDIDDLLNKPRFHKNYNNNENNCRGLNDLIAEFLTNSTIMCEIGNFAGVSSELFARQVQLIFCIDPYLSYNEIDYALLLNAEKDFIIMAQNYSNINKFKKTSSEASMLFDNNFFDFVYIDGAHDYDNVHNDINKWLPKIKTTGYIGGHDYNQGSVQQAITNNNLNIIKVFSDTSWISKVPSP